MTEDERIDEEERKREKPRKAEDLCAEKKAETSLVEAETRRQLLEIAETLEKGGAGDADWRAKRGHSEESTGDAEDEAEVSEHCRRRPPSAEESGDAAEESAGEAEEKAPLEKKREKAAQTCERYFDDLSETKCFNCGQKGHWKGTCPRKEKVR